MITQKEIAGRFLVMSDEKRAVFLREFPWLNWLFEKGKGHPVIQFYVSRITMDFLKITPAPKDIVAPQAEWIFFADRDGHLISWKELRVKRTSKIFFWRKKTVEEEIYTVPNNWSVEQVFVLKLGDRVKEICYAISYYHGTFVVIVYKSPRDFSFVEWFEALKKKAEIEVAEEIRAIDDEPIKLGIR